MIEQTQSRIDTVILSDIELSIQAVYLGNQILIVCTGPSGESFVFIGEDEAKILLKKSLLLHQRIDKFIKDEADGKTISIQQRAKLDEYLKQLGELLFKLVFKNSILDIFHMTIGQSIRLNKNILIRIMIANDFLNAIPWELFFDGRTYLCHTYDIIRHPITDHPVRRGNVHNSIPRVLFVGSNPLNDILVENQIKAVEEAIQPRKQSFQCLLSPDANYTNIASRIYDGVDILHFLAHGRYDNNNGYSKYYFIIDSEDANRKQDKLPVEMLESFCRANPMQFAVLNACRSDQAINYNIRSIKKLTEIKYYSMAHALIQTGVPCVIGMSHPISKGGAEIFTRRLYRTVVDRQESVGKAIRQIRLELFAHTNDLLPSDWLTPVLYSRESQSSSSLSTLEPERVV